MIQFIKKTDPQPLSDRAQDNRFEEIRKAAADRHRKGDADGRRRRDRQTVEDNRLR